ncbi:MAG: glycosyltransferase family 2 protein [Heliobacteriaceae bacterium]|jgi:1,2-diacylglycerol 3-beta-glucosyltransferase|nr:glycosyltransferase family 2 protein [Heliobacteriaceae bacterium]
MKERIILFTIVFGLGVFLYIFQSYFNTVWGLAFLCALMFVYAFFSSLAYHYKKRRLQKYPLIVNEDYKPFVSVLIPGHNEECVITHTVENILAMDYGNFEVIVIDDRSDDNTASVIKQLEKKYDKVTALIRDKDAFPGKSAVLNDAMQTAKGEAVLVFDADATVEPDFLTKLVPHLEPKDVGAVQARKVIRNKDCNFLTRCQNNEYTMDAHFQVSRDSVKGAVELRGNGELIKREALEDIGGWNNYTITDDLDMSTRLHIKGWDVRFCLDAVVYEEGIIYLWPLFRQRRRWLEGTFRRYLEYSGEALTSKDMSLRVSVDMFAYISEFIMPMWLIMEIIIRGFKVLAKDAPPHMLYSSIILGCVIGVAFLLAARYSLRRYDNLTRMQALKEAVETSVYLFVIWFPLVLFICLKILFLKKDMKWGKTAHGLVAEEEEHLAAKAKRLTKQVIDKAKEKVRI